ncbi:hypothetical protein PPACK8108_LOCUS20029 [Phakopsora pachyrhizi]|uniref:Wbp11/ELF5/Saf1 N-terminal domain-containing protein n=1 Tax=Phakopsora pachyrhizi TaxID=170000 RepID=A0AAV0BGW9_PHAPC|nr:hypothetical protein PPACK8108_LOCUS20029 [Phakopsora pachyrhizi]
MAKKSKTLNPADAFRKAQRQKEIKRNKLDRKKARESAKSKKDPKAIDAEIRQLERLSKPTQSEQTRLKDLKKELQLIINAKEHQGLINKDSERSNISISSGSNVIIDPVTGLPTVSDPSKSNDQASGSNSHSKNATANLNPRTRDWFGPDGKLLEPERSVYYDPVFNPFGVPPPGMPLRMKSTPEPTPEPSSSVSQPMISNPDEQTCDPTTPVGVERALENGAEAEKSDQDRDKGNTYEEDAGDEDDSDEDGEDDDEDEENEDEDEDEDIPMPEGSPPSSTGDSETDSDDDIPLPEGPPPPKPIILPNSNPVPLISRPAKIPPNLNNHQNPGPMHLLPPPPAPFILPPIVLAPGAPPPPLIAGMGMPSFPMGLGGFPIPPPPPPPRNFQPFSNSPRPANLPPRPIMSSTVSSPADVNPQNSTPKPVATQTGATVTALPQLRDLKREPTSFVPSAIRKKRKELDRRAGLAGLGNSNRIQAAPDGFDDKIIMDSSENPNGKNDESCQPKQLTTSLLGALKRDGLIGEVSEVKNGHRSAGAEKDDYEKFVESLGDVL